MIFRLSQKVATKIKASALSAMPLHSNPLADWSTHLFTVSRNQYVIVTNTASLYSTLFLGKGITTERQFVEASLRAIKETVNADGLGNAFDLWIASEIETVLFSKALNRSVTGSMNDLIFQAKVHLLEDNTPIQELAANLNGTPFSSLKYLHPREEFQKLAIKVT